LSGIGRQEDGEGRREDGEGRREKGEGRREKGDWRTVKQETGKTSSRKGAKMLREQTGGGRREKGFPCWRYCIALNRGYCTCFLMIAFFVKWYILVYIDVMRRGRLWNQ